MGEKEGWPRGMVNGRRRPLLTFSRVRYFYLFTFYFFFFFCNNNIPQVKWTSRASRAGIFYYFFFISYLFSFRFLLFTINISRKWSDFTVSSGRDSGARIFWISFGNGRTPDRGFIVDAPKQKDEKQVFRTISRTYK